MRCSNDRFFLALTHSRDGLAPPSRGGHGVRWDLVCRLREEIARGDYETRDKLRIVADRLLRRLES